MEQVNRQTNELTLTRVFDAPRELVFEVFSTCEYLNHWWGTRQWPISYCKMDFRPGGTWHYCLQGPNKGDESWGLTTYREIVKPQRIVYTDVFADKDSNPAKGMPEMLITLTFDKQGARTKLTSVTKFASLQELDNIIKLGALEGFNETWDRLDEYLATLQQRKTHAREK
jgi:uncharacterized protein YndB with AHSA1/START domain